MGTMERFVDRDINRYIFIFVCVFVCMYVNVCLCFFSSFLNLSLDDSFYGESLTGFWKNGEPFGPFNSCEKGTGSHTPL